MSWLGGANKNQMQYDATKHQFRLDLGTPNGGDAMLALSLLEVASAERVSYWQAII
jgi:hypothetical protein